MCIRDRPTPASCRQQLVSCINQSAVIAAHSGHDNVRMHPAYANGKWETVPPGGKKSCKAYTYNSQHYNGQTTLASSI